MSINKNTSTIVDPSVKIDKTVRDDREFRYTSETYQKVLDYHVAEILLSTIVLAVIALLRLHH